MTDNKKDSDWYSKQVRGLYLILEDKVDDEVFISRDYVKEKLLMIIEETGINFHPSIKHAIGIKTNTCLDED